MKHFYANLLEIFPVKTFDKDNKFRLVFAPRNELGHTCRAIGRNGLILNFSSEKTFAQFKCASINYHYCDSIVNL